MRAPRIGLRNRVSLAFALGSLVLSSSLALTTYAVAGSYLFSQRQQSTLRQAVFNARVLSGVLSTSRPAIEDSLQRIDALGGQSSSPLLLRAGRWYDDRLVAERGAGHEALPGPLLEAVRDRQPVTQRIEFDGELALAVALPLETADAVYVEVFTLRELDRTLTALTTILFGAATATTVLGLFLGRWASGRALRPLEAVTAAADSVASGNLATRLDVRGDPDLAGLAQAFNDNTARLERRVELDARFAANVSHELRSPLTTMVNAVELLKARSAEMPGESREVTDLLALEVRRMANMVGDLLEISRPDAGVISTEPLNPATLVRLVADRAVGRPVTEVEPGAEQLVLSGDKRRLEQVIVNLVDNAVAHAGGVTQVHVAQRAGYLRVTVEDDGPGVPAEDREQIFERFSRGRQTGPRAAEGVGLGLALVREHVRLHDGSVWVEDRAGGGARFVVELPLEEDHA